MNLDKDALQDIITNRRKITNCFIFYNEIIELLKADDSYSYLSNDNFFILLKANGFYKFYYFVNKLEDIFLAKEFIKKYSNDFKISLEFTTKHYKNIDKITKILNEMNFEFYSEFARLISGQNNLKTDKEKDKKRSITFNLANEKDIDNLAKVMYSEFDVIIDDLPDKEELLSLIKSESIILKYVENKIIFIQIFERKQSSLYSRMTWIQKKFRKPRYTVDIYNSIDAYLEYLTKKEDFKNVRAYYWVDVSNKNFAIGQKLGSKPDGLRCTTFVYQNMKV